MSLIKFCIGNCISKFQDQRYGMGRRLHTEGPKQGKTCTVCGRKS